MAIQRPRRQDQAWLRIWSDKATLSSGQGDAQAGDSEGPEALLSKTRLAEESMGRLLAMDAELDVLWEALRCAPPPADGESMEAVDGARRGGVGAAWRRRAAEPTAGVLCYW